MLTTVHYFTRRASRERRLAREALTETARQRHAGLADHFSLLAQRAHEGQLAEQAMGGWAGLKRVKRSLGYFSAVVAAALVAGCASAPTPAPVARATPKKELSYRWTHGHSDKGRQAALATFGTINLAPGDFRWAGSIPAEGETDIVVDLLTQTAFVYRADQLVGMTTISSGKKGKETQLGFWKVLSKRKDYRSRKYDNAPMPFAQMIDDKGIALHGGKLPGYPASRGCVRLPMKFAEKLFALTKLGTKVVIEG